MPPKSSRIVGWGVVLLILLTSSGLRAADETSETACTTNQEPGAPRPLSDSASALSRGNDNLRNGRAELALADYRESGRLAEADGNESARVLAQANAARAMVETSEFESVASVLGDLVEEVRRSDGFMDASVRARLLIHFARTWERLASRGHPKQSNRARLRAVLLLDEASELAVEARDDRLISYALGYRGGLYEGAGRSGDARVLTRRALLAANRVGAHDALYRWYWQLARIERRTGRGEAALSAYRLAVRELAVVRADLESSVLSSIERADGESVYRELVDLILDRVRSADPGERQPMLKEALDTIERSKAEELRDYFEDPCLAAQRAVSPDEVPGAVVLYPVLLPDRVELILGRGGQLSLHGLSISPAELEVLVRSFRRRLPDRVLRSYLKPAAQLYDFLIRPIEKDLVGADVLVVIPDGPLRSIPFAALFDSRTKSYLVQKIAIAATPGLTLTDPRPISGAVSKALVAGISEAIQGYPPLSSVQAEVANVQATYPSIVMLNEDFEIRRFEEALASNLVQVVHIASHGEFRPESSESYLLAYDGRLSMERLTRSIGRTRLRTDEPLELLVLSACETAAGNDRAALGLAGVALQAGARSAIATLWSVNDVAAERIIRRFYAELRDGQSRAEALRAAQIELIEDSDFAHAANWSPFLLISNWL